MGKEIKIVYEEVQQSLDTFQETSQSISTTTLDKVGVDNLLDSVDKLNNVNLQVNQLVQSYQNLLIINASGSKELIQSMKNVDKKLSNSIK
ncbi:DUF5344 family protein [Salipaludibacillus agaradhaerens]|uniref:DUF5344 family protein n=1 Tax=Salipaludibacillus agaradhaerens TaxID=76935 RepID=UPI0009960DA9|nr:DUF5344 family protein [Salipaludibacillus agaradhaerens]